MLSGPALILLDCCQLQPPFTMPHVQPYVNQHERHREREDHILLDPKLSIQPAAALKDKSMLESLEKAMPAGQK